MADLWPEGWIEPVTEQDHWDGVDLVLPKPVYLVVYIWLRRCCWSPQRKSNNLFHKTALINPVKIYQSPNNDNDLTACNPLQYCLLPLFIFWHAGFHLLNNGPTFTYFFTIDSVLSHSILVFIRISYFVPSDLITFYLIWPPLCLYCSFKFLFSSSVWLIHLFHIIWIWTCQVSFISEFISSHFIIIKMNWI